ncbi:MAG: DNA-protecting protein DprA [Deltaproteobacteria bacterium]|nr:MAG: DNA-protecting protein DprA [Deltaproteobacteria bacterium]
MMNAVSWKEMLIALNTIDGIPPAQLDAMKTHFERHGSLPDASGLVRNLGLRPKAARRISRIDFSKVIHQEQKATSAQNIRIDTIDEPEYPTPLKEIYSPPPLLYRKGEYLPEDQTAIAIVGSRQADYRGKSLAKTLAASLAKRGITIVSGLARGIDTQAHLGALEAGGRTIGVLGSGFNHFYPAENKDLGEKIAHQGCVYSEFPCYRPPAPRNFPRRNRIISGLSLGVVVIQATKRSGSLITARLALEQGREVFALPGPPESPLSRGCHALIKQGAKLVEDVNDILEELALPNQSRETAPTQAPPRLKGLAARLYEHIGSEPIQIDQLCQISETDPKDVLPTLLSMEIMGVIVRLPGQCFARKDIAMGENR